MPCTGGGGISIEIRQFGFFIAMIIAIMAKGYNLSAFY
jgi:hypothetical protein